MPKAMMYEQMESSHQKAQSAHKNPLEAVPPDDQSL